MTGQSWNQSPADENPRRMATFVVTGLVTGAVTGVAAPSIVFSLGAMMSAEGESAEGAASEMLLIGLVFSFLTVPAGIAFGAVVGLLTSFARPVVAQTRPGIRLAFLSAISVALSSGLLLLMGWYVFPTLLWFVPGVVFGFLAVVVAEAFVRSRQRRQGGRKLSSERLPTPLV